MTPASDGGPGRRSRVPHERRSSGRPSPHQSAVVVLLGLSALGLGACGSAADTTAGSDLATVESAPKAAADSSSQVTSPGATAPRTARSEPLLTAAPDGNSQVGALVEGFPISLLPVPSDSMILVTSAVPVGTAGVEEVSLNLRTSATVDEILALYRTTLGQAGFTEVPPPEPQTNLAAETTFTRSSGDELVSIGILDSQGSRTVTIGGRVRTTG